MFVLPLSSGRVAPRCARQVSLAMVALDMVLQLAWRATTLSIRDCIWTGEPATVPGRYRALELEMLKRPALGGLAVPRLSADPSDSSLSPRGNPPQARPYLIKERDRMVKRAL
jgi:hypothetical protein